MEIETKQDLIKHVAITGLLVVGIIMVIQPFLGADSNSAAMAFSDAITLVVGYASAVWTFRKKIIPDEYDD